MGVYCSPVSRIAIGDSQKGGQRHDDVATLARAWKTPGIHLLTKVATFDRRFTILLVQSGFVQLDSRAGESMLSREPSLRADS